MLLSPRNRGCMLPGSWFCPVVKRRKTILAIEVGFLPAKFPIVRVEAHHTEKFSPTDRWPLFGEKGFWTELDDVASFQPVLRLPQASSVNMKLEPQLLSCHGICMLLGIFMFNH